MSKKRSKRQGISLDRAVMAGPEDLNEIVYGYTFPSKQGRIKIGYSSRGLQRIVEQTTGFPEKPIVLFVLRDKEAFHLEKRFHEAFAGKQSDVVGTEWFDVSMRDVFDVSPTLRQAAGVKRRGTWLRVAASVLIAALVMVALPVLMVFASGLFQGWPLDSIMMVARAYLGAVLSGDVSSGLDIATQTVSAVSKSKTVWAVVPLCAGTLGLAYGPWALRRKEVF